MNMRTREEQVAMVPPDGGWGWFIVVGSILINFSTKPLGTDFGLVFGDLFKQLGIETTGASVVITTMDTIFNLTGLAVGPLIRIYSNRKVAILGAVISTSAILLTAPANSMLHILITFGVLGGIGFGLVGACSLVGMNDYFSKRKGQAVGLSMTGTGVGFMLMPQIIRILLDEYDFRSTLLILGAISLHAVVGASLFQPVSWHKKPEVMEVTEEAHTFLSPDKIVKKDLLPASIETTNGARHNVSSPNFEGRKNLFNIPSQAFYRKGSLISNISLLDDARNTLPIQGITDEESDKTTKKSVKNCLSRFSKNLDLDLLRDGVYLNILYGLSMCYVAEMNFRLIIPFFLSNHGFTRPQIATALSSMGALDICARLFVPPIVDRIAYSWRTTFMIGLIGVGLSFACFAVQTTVGPTIIVLAVNGFFQGLTLTSFPLVLAEYSSKDNFPSALGLSMVFKGIITAVIGPVSGYIRDVTNSYPLYIYFQTMLICSVLVAWNIELFIIKSKNKKQTIVDVLQKETEDKITMTKA